MYTLIVRLIATRLKQKIKSVLYELINRHFHYFNCILKAERIPAIAWNPEISIWAIRGFGIPSPPEVKRETLKRYSIALGPWIETGTYFGGTTRFLSLFSEKVISIEPSYELYTVTKERLGNISNIELRNGTSEECFVSAIKEFDGNLNIFLDGHYSEGITYQAEVDTPLKFEVTTIIEFLDNFEEIRLFIDDVRCMNPTISGFEDYPTLLELLKLLSPYTDRFIVENDIAIFYLRPRNHSK